VRSVRALIGSAIIVLSYPAALCVQLLSGRGAETVIHFVAGAGFIVFATSVFDFALPRWVNVVGAAAASAFGAIFVLQGISDVTQLGDLGYVAFDVLGHHVERLLPDVIYLWFVALLLLASQGRWRVAGAAIMLIVIGLELTTWASLLLGFQMPNVKVIILLPFVWLLLESRKSTEQTMAGVGERGQVGGGTDPQSSRFRGLV